MATQGVVSLVRDGEVAMKFVAGCNGQNAKLLALSVRTDGVGNLDSALRLGLACGFGCPECLVVVGKDGHVTHALGDPVSPLFRQTFADPNFNPRWELGSADYVEVVEQ